MKTRDMRLPLSALCGGALQFVHLSRSSSCLAAGLSPRPGSFGTDAGAVLLRRRRRDAFVFYVEQSQRDVMSVIWRKMNYKN